MLDKADMLDRAAQVAGGALEAGDPDTFDTDLLSRLLSRLCEKAPDLSDDLFRPLAGFRHVGDRAQPGQPARPGAGFCLPRRTWWTRPRKISPSKSIQASGVTVEDLTATRNSANPDNIQALIEATLKLLANPTAANRNPAVAYALAYAAAAAGARSDARPRRRI